MSFAGRRRLRVAGSATQPPGTDWGAPGIGGGDPPPEEDITWAPNQPEGFTLYGDTTFEQDSPEPDGWNIAVASDLPTRAPAVVADDGPFNDQSYRVRYNDGMTFGTAAWIDITGSVTAKRLYKCWTFKTSANWVNEASVCKISYDNAGAGGAEIGIRPNGAVDSGTFRWSLETYPSGGGGNFLVNSANPGSVNTLYMMEALLVRNTPGSSDGQFRLWASAWNGTDFDASVLLLSTDEARFAGAAESANFTVPRWDFYRGGSGTPTLTADQFLFINRVRLAHKAD